MKRLSIFIIILFISNFINAQSGTWTTIELNGIWDFDQTLRAFPPQQFTRKCPVPGLVHLAEPKIEDYDKFFKKPKKVVAKKQHSVLDIDYTPRYSWYRKKVFIEKGLEGKTAILTIKKSQYVTDVYVNGWHAGGSMACYTPIDLNITPVLKYGENNEILIRVGDRIWLPSEAAGGTDKEKEHYLPGIWDDVFLTFTGKIKLHRVLLLPSLKDKHLTAKIFLRSYYPSQLFYGHQIEDSVQLKVNISEKNSGKTIAAASAHAIAIRDHITEVVLEIPMENAHAWSPGDPFLYVAEIEVDDKGSASDRHTYHFGMRDFERRGKYFYLNGEKTFLRGTNITLQRFFEDPECGALAWDREWVKKLLIDYSKELNWNMMRICVGIAPDFWYDLADEYGLMLQNEWLYWQHHGWDGQIRKEYTDWVMSDGNHPSIVIWDAINENRNAYIGNVLIQDLMKLDPTRIWDAGYMTATDMRMDEMDEPHPYEGPEPWVDLEKYVENPYPLGNLNYRNESNIRSMESGAAQLVNEYGWVWLWRDGQPSKLTVNFYKYFLSEHSSPTQNREFQAYWLQLETEWLRSIREHAGVLAFTHLTNNYGYTGDWFIDHIKDLRPSPVLYWFRHAFAPAAVFINMTDERYVKDRQPHEQGSELLLVLAGVNDFREKVSGKVAIAFYDKNGIKSMGPEIDVTLLPDIRTNIPVAVALPEKGGGYLMTATFTPDDPRHGKPVVSRRYIKVGDMRNYRFFDMKY